MSSQTRYVFAPAPPVSAAMRGSTERFPVQRIYCVGRNYEDHAKEMGFTGREAVSYTHLTLPTNREV